jgi:membrane protease subunit (stomatin/prohibitin family)
MGIRYSALPGHTAELAQILNQVLSEKWYNLRGIQIVSLGVSSVKASDEDEAMIKELQRNAAFRNPNMAAAQLVGAQSAAMQAAASNQNAGPAMAFAGMNMAAGAGGMNAQNLFAMGQQSAYQNASQQTPAAPQQPAAAVSAPSGEWTCSCGTVNTGKFCGECGSPRPSADWTCSCGTRNTGKFCSECGKPRT